MSSDLTTKGPGVPGPGEEATNEGKLRLVLAYG